MDLLSKYFLTKPGYEVATLFPFKIEISSPFVETGTPNRKVDFPKPKGKISCAFTPESSNKSLPVIPILSSPDAT